MLVSVGSALIDVLLRNAVITDQHCAMRRLEMPDGVEAVPAFVYDKNKKPRRASVTCSQSESGRARIFFQRCLAKDLR